MSMFPEELSPEENLRAETEILKLKMELETGAFFHVSDEHQLPADLEFAWINHIYNYEKLCKEAGTARVYDFIGQPSFKTLDELAPEEVGPALVELLLLMNGKGIDLTFEPDCYPSVTIYKFIIEELFPYEVNRYLGPDEGGCWVFCYEDFHPNHQSDLNRYTFEYLDALLGYHEWNPDFLDYTHDEIVSINGLAMPLINYSNTIVDFHTCYPKSLFEDWDIVHTEINLESAIATVFCSLKMAGEKEYFEITYRLSNDYWIITGLNLKYI